MALGKRVVGFVCGLRSVCVPLFLPLSWMAIQWGLGSVWGGDYGVHMCLR